MVGQATRGEEGSHVRASDFIDEWPISCSHSPSLLCQEGSGRGHLSPSCLCGSLFPILICESDHLFSSSKDKGGCLTLSKRGLLIPSQFSELLLHKKNSQSPLSPGITWLSPDHKERVLDLWSRLSGSGRCEVSGVSEKWSLGRGESKSSGSPLMTDLLVYLYWGLGTFVSGSRLALG